MREELKITVSAVAIGDQANIPLLKRIAQYGGGLFHHTYDPATLPQIILRDIKEEDQEEPVGEKDSIPVLVRGSTLLSKFPERSFPPVKGFVETEMKRGAALDLMIPRSNKRIPLLASWNHGKGRSVVFTTDLHGRWTKDWVRWKKLERFWSSVFDWLIPPMDPLPPHEVRINLLKAQPVMDLYLYREKIDESLFRYSFNGKDGKGKGFLTMVAPGHYRTILPFSKPGDYRIQLVEETSGKKHVYPELGYTLPFDPGAERPQGSFNRRLLEQLARSTGGEINPKRGQSLTTEEVIRTSRSLRFFPIMLAVILFFLEIFFRRFVLRQIIR
jgi:hypothetical protein